MVYDQEDSPKVHDHVEILEPLIILKHEGKVIYCFYLNLRITSWNVKWMHEPLLKDSSTLLQEYKQFQGLDQVQASQRAK